jgi:hypothetical protein
MIIFRMLSMFFLLSFVLQCESLAPRVRKHGHATLRRTILSLPFLVAAQSVSSSLDFDAFINKQLSMDQDKPEFTSDEALCKFGQPSPSRGDACIRAGISPKSTGSKGGVDAFGKIDRGDFVRCKTSYDLENGKYVKTTLCE